MQTQTELNFAAAESAKQAGMMVAEEHTNSVTPGWSYMAMNYLRMFLAETDAPFQLEEVRQWSYAKGLTRPEHERAWGGIAAKARNLHLITFAGTRQTSSPTAHNAIASLWKKA